MLNMQKMMRQVQKMQAEMEKVQESLKELTVEGTAGGGVVKVKANGQQEILSIEIQPDVVDPDDIEMLQDLITAAVNEALRDAKDIASEKMGEVTGGMNIPGLPGM